MEKKKWTRIKEQREAMGKEWKEIRGKEEEHNEGPFISQENDKFKFNIILRWRQNI